MSTPTLVCISGARQGETWEITEAGLRLGRDDSNDIPLKDPAVSRFHGRVILHNNGIWVQDAGSRNGVFVNDVRVTSNKQIGPGDRVTIGEHVFMIELVEDDPEASVSVDLGALEVEPPTPAPDAGRRWRLWPFLVAVLLVLGCVGVISSLAGDDAAPETPVGAVGEASPYSLAAALEGASHPDPGASKEGKKDAEIGLDEALAAASGATAAASKAWPDPPPGATVEELVDAGHSHYRAGRLRDALTHYHMALKLDADCEICARRIERVNEEIAAAVAENFDAGLRYYESLQYQQAINAWETVLMLEPDPAAQVHVRTQEYLARARERLDARP